MYNKFLVSDIKQHFYLYYVKFNPNVIHIHHQHLVNCVIYRIFGHKTALLVCKQTLCHKTVSIVQIPVWCLNIHRTGASRLRNVTSRIYATLRHIRDASAQVPVQTALGASHARRLIDASGAQRSFTLSRMHSSSIQRSV